uniref:Uncharacterized protein n=1 Tax=Romanomermis culicivorax TaxID=13658 RepID=A0A915JTA0_ROMCU
MENYGEKITARDFYKESAVPLEETVLWSEVCVTLCKLPDGRPCTIGDFQVKFTDGGVCFQLTTRITTKEGAHVPNVPDCSLLRQMKCVDRQGGIYEETESSTLINTHVPPCIGECTIIDYDKELSYATFRDRSTFKNMLGDEKMKRIKRVYENGHESATLVNIIRKNDPQIEELQIIAAAYQNLIVDRKIVPPYGSILDKFLAKHPCLKNHFVVQTSAEYNSRSFLKSIFEQFNPQLFDQLIDNIQKLEIKLQLLNLDHLIHLAENVSQAYFEACSAQNDLLCGLSVIYDLIEVRKILSSKYNEIESIQKEFGDEFSRLVAIYRSQNDSKINQLLPNLENYTLFDDESNSTVMLISYLGHVTLCLKHLYQIYGRQLANGQPSFKTKDSYKSFLTDLRLANFTIHFFCNKKSGEDDENPKSGVSMINPKNDLSKITGYRKALAKNLIQELVNTNRSLNNLLKEARFNVTILSFLDELKILDDSTAKYESGVLQQSLYDMNMFSRLVKTYLNQTVNSRITKNMFYEDLVRLNAGFQQGMT